MTFPADYPGSIVYPAHPSNYYLPENHGGVPNRPRALFLHTPEEPADDYESTPVYFSQPNRQASTHYYADSDGDWYQLVPERCMAIANGLIGKPLPLWAEPDTSLNWQSLSVEIEGYAATIHQTCVRGGPQWNAIVRWVEDRTRIHNIPLDREHVMGHKEVANNRSDPGQLDINAIVADALALRIPQEEDDMELLGQFAATIPWQKSYKVIMGADGVIRKVAVKNAAEYEALKAAGYPTKALPAIGDIPDA